VLQSKVRKVIGRDFRMSSSASVSPRLYTMTGFSSRDLMYCRRDLK